MPNFTAMFRVVACLFSFVLLFSCKQKKPDVPAEQFFPAAAYLKGEITRMDKLPAKFYKIETLGGKTDTVAITGAEAKGLAADFYALPDIGSDKLKNDYQVTHTYDDALNAFVFMFTTKEDHLVQREDVVLDPVPDAKGNYGIISIFAEQWQTSGNTTIRKNMLWNANKNFQVTTITEADGNEKTKKLQVVWNGFDGPTR